MTKKNINRSTQQHLVTQHRPHHKKNKNWTGTKHLFQVMVVCSMVQHPLLFLFEERLKTDNGFKDYLIIGKHC